MMAQELPRIHFNRDKHLAIRIYNVMALLLGQLYSKEQIRDTDLFEGDQLGDPQLEELSMRMALATRQTKEKELESFENLKQSLRDQERKRRES